MPYFFETHKIRLPRHKDRRVKLTNQDRQEIRDLYQEGWSIRAIARKFDQVSRRLIQFILFPERITAARKNRDWRDYYKKNKWRVAMRGYRKYKYQTLKGKI